LLSRYFPAEAHISGPEFERHTALYSMASSLDHVVPHGRGGKNSPENLVTACYCCQFGRGEWLLEEVGLTDPRGREPVRDSWDGLSRIVAVRLDRDAVGIAHRAIAT
jgi:5-methylcytosine-specific restriction endonuclease McrA